MTYAQSIASAYLAVVLDREVEGEARDTLCLGARRDLQALDDARIALVLQAGVLSLRVLTNDSEVDVVVARGYAREGLAKNNGRVNVELLTHGDVPRDVTGLGDGREENTCSAEFSGVFLIVRQKSAPLRPTLLRFKLSIACLKRTSPSEDIPETLYCSHSMGALT